MDRVEQLAKECQKAFSMPAVPLIGMIDQELDVADEVGQAKLQGDVLVQGHVFSIGTEVIAAQ